MGSVTDLLEEARDAGLEVRVDGDRLVVRGPRSAAALARQLLDRKPEVVAALVGPTESEADEPNDWWEEVTEEDREYLLGPRVDDPPTLEQLSRLKAWRADRHPGKCFFCAGRKVHNPNCYILAFSSVLPFGRYKGRQISEVPQGYLVWLLGNSSNLTPGLRVEIQRAVQQAKSPPRRLRSGKDEALMNEPPGCAYTQTALTTTQPLMGGPRHG
jgi:hypothetical protein